MEDAVWLGLQKQTKAWPALCPESVACRGSKFKEGRKEGGPCHLRLKRKVAILTTGSFREDVTVVGNGIQDAGRENDEG